MICNNAFIKLLVIILTIFLRPDFFNYCSCSRTRFHGPVNFNFKYQNTLYSGDGVNHPFRCTSRLLYHIYKKYIVLLSYAIAYM